MTQQPMPTDNPTVVVMIPRAMDQAPVLRMVRVDLSIRCSFRISRSFRVLRFYAVGPAATISSGMWAYFSEKLCWNISTSLWADSS